MKRATTHDIATAAGVSLATVDRVLNRRAGVRHQTVERVEAAMAQLNYMRDPSAAALSRNRSYPIMFILPEGANNFMHLLTHEIADAAQAPAYSRVQVAIRKVPPFDGPALAACLAGIDPAATSGIVAVATDTPEVREQIARLRRQQVKVVTLVSDIAAEYRDHFVGIDNVAAGRTAGRLMGQFLAHRPGKIAVVAGSMRVKDHVERRLGFDQVMHADFPQLEVLPSLEGQDDADLVAGLLQQTFAAHPDIVGVYSLGAGTRGVISVLKALSPHQRPTTLAHELTEPSRSALIDGTLHAVLNQDARVEVISAIEAVQQLVDGEKISTALPRPRIEIFLKENLP